MRGSISLPFSELFTDTVKNHGVKWAWKHYAKKGMEQWEFRFWLKACWNSISI